MRNKYKYNPELLRYVRIKTSFKRFFLYFLTYAFALFIISLALNIAYTAFFDTPKDKQLKRENSQLLFQYTLLNKQFTRVEKVLSEIQLRDDNIYRTIFEAEPIPNSIREAGIGGVDNYKEFNKYSNAELIIQTKLRLDKIKKKLYIQSKSYDEIITLSKNKEKMISCIPAIMPISNKGLTRTASGWGYRIHPIYKIKKFHYGMDFTAPTGTEIYVTGDGVIQEARYIRGYGNAIIVDHGFGYKTLYAHMQKFNVRKRQHVKRGDVIGFVGTTGISTGPHLHYEVIKNNVKVNPANFYFNDLTPNEYEIMIAISAKSGQTFD